MTGNQVRSGTSVLAWDGENSEKALIRNRYDFKPYGKKFICLSARVKVINTENWDFIEAITIRFYFDQFGVRK
jgi:hypothetical protein